MNTLAGGDPTSTVVPDPSQDSPNLLFNTGMVVNGLETYETTPSPLPQPLSTWWDITQWGKAMVIDPADVVLDDPTTADATYGVARYNWKTTDGNTAVGVYETAQGLVFRLFSQDAIAPNGNGGANLFLQTQRVNVPDLAKVTNLSLDAKVAGIVGGTAFGVQYDVGLTLNFNVPGSAAYDASLPTRTLFLQLNMGGTGGKPGPYLQINGPSAIVNVNFAGNRYLDYAADSGPMHSLSYSVNANLLAAVQSLIAQGFVTASANDLSRWSLTGLYVGQEDFDTGNPAAPVGSTLDVGDISFTQSTDLTYDPGQDVAGVYQSATGAGATDVTLNVAGLNLLTCNGRDTVEAGDRYVTVHGAGATLSVNGGSGTVSVDGAATLSFLGGSGQSTISGSGIGDWVSLGAGDASVRTALAAFIRMGDGDATIVGGAGTTTLEGGAGTLTYSAGTPQSRGILALGSGDATISGGSNTIFGGAGQLDADTAGIIVLGGGAATVTGTDTTLFCGSGALDWAGGSGIVILGSGAASLSGGTVADHVAVFGGTGSFDYCGGAESATVIGGTGSDTIDGGSGGGWYTAGTAGNSLLQAMGGNTVLTGEASGDTLRGGGGGGNWLVAGAGNETLVGGRNTPTYAFLGTGSDNVRLAYVAGGGSTVVGGAGAATIAGGNGASHDQVWLGAGPAILAIGCAGTMDVMGFRVGTDHVDLALSAADGSGTLLRTSISGDSTLLSFSGGGELVLHDVITTQPGSLFTV